MSDILTNLLGPNLSPFTPFPPRHDDGHGRPRGADEIGEDRLGVGALVRSPLGRVALDGESRISTSQLQASFHQELTEIYRQFHGGDGAESAVSQISQSLSAELTRVSSESGVSAIEFRLATVATQFTAVDGPAGRYFELAVEVNLVSATATQAGNASLFSITGGSIEIEAAQLEIGHSTGMYQRDLALPNADLERTQSAARATLDIIERLRETQTILRSLREGTLGEAINLIANGLFAQDAVSSRFDA